MWPLYLVAVFAGIANAIEPGQNASLAKAIGNPLLAGIICFGLCLLLFLAAIVTIGRQNLPDRRKLVQVPWWAWPGGLLGAVVVLAQLYVSEQIGAAPFLGFVVTAGVVGSVLLDHHGLVGFERHSANRWRIFGSALMIAGVALVTLF